MNNREPLKTVVQVARELGLAAVTVRSWLAQRRISYVKLGRSVRIPDSEVQRLIEEGTVPERPKHR